MLAVIRKLTVMAEIEKSGSNPELCEQVYRGFKKAFKLRSRRDPYETFLAGQKLSNKLNRRNERGYKRTHSTVYYGFLSSGVDDFCETRTIFVNFIRQLNTFDENINMRKKYPDVVDARHMMEHFAKRFMKVMRCVSDPT